MEGAAGQGGNSSPMASLRQSTDGQPLPPFHAHTRGRPFGRHPRSDVGIRRVFQYPSWPAGRRLREKIDLEQIEHAVREEFGVGGVEALRMRGRRGNEASAAAIYVSREQTRIPVREIGRHFGNVSGQAVGNIVRQVERDKRFAARRSAVREQCRMTP